MSAYTHDGSDLMLIVLAVVVIGLAVWAVSRLFPAYPTPAKATGRDNTPTKWAKDVQANSIQIHTRHYNTLKTTIFLAALTALLVVVGSWLGGTGGMMIAFGLAMVLHGVAYWFSDRLALRPAGASLQDTARARMDGADAIDAQTPTRESAAPEGRGPSHGAAAKASRHMY
jgi:hypothetical protein